LKAAADGAPVTPDRDFVTKGDPWPGPAVRPVNRRRYRRARGRFIAVVGLRKQDRRRPTTGCASPAAGPPIDASPCSLALPVRYRCNALPRN
jgi:hypothetical protein